jgi:protease-4
MRDGFTTADKIGIAPIDGVIKDSTDVVKNLQEFGKDDSVKGVILRINSPGGALPLSGDLRSGHGTPQEKKSACFHEFCGRIRRISNCLCREKIIANPGTLTGSVSAIMYFTNAEELMKKVGVKASTIKSGKYKDIGSPIREMTGEEKALLQGLVDDIYIQFLDVVVRNRRISEEALKQIADGRIFTGKQAQQLGLVDYLGDMEYAVRMLAKMVGISGEPVVVYPRKKYESMLDYFFERAGSTMAHVFFRDQTIPYGIHYLADTYGLRMLAPAGMEQ